MVVQIGVFCGILNKLSKEPFQFHEQACEDIIIDTLCDQGGNCDASGFTPRNLSALHRLHL